MVAQPASGADRIFAAIAAVIAASLVLKLAFIAATVGSDDMRYFFWARRLAFLQPFNELDHAASRLAFLGIVGVPGAWVGHMAASCVVNVLLATATEILVARYVWTRIGRVAALPATLVLAFSGIVLTYAGTLGPDTLLALIFAVAALLVFRQIDNGSGGNALLLGAVLGLGYSTKDTGILLVPPVLFAVTFLASGRSFGRRVADAMLVALGAVGVWVLDCIGLWLLTGDFFYRASALSGVHNYQMGAAGSAREYVARIYWNLLLVIDDADVLVPTAVLAALACLAIVRRGGAATFLALAIGFCWLYLVAGSSSLSRPVNLPFQDRYVQPLLPLIAIALAMMLGPAPRAPMRAITFGLLGITAVLALHGSLQRVGNRFFEPYVQASADVVRAMPLSPERPLHVDYRTYQGLQWVLDDTLLKRVRVLADRTLPERGLLLLHPNYGTYSDAQKAVLAQAPRVIDTRLDGRLYARLFPRIAPRPTPYRFTVYRLDDNAPGAVAPAR